MDYVFVVENEEAHRHRIQKALNEINPALGIMNFHDLKEFYGWMKEIMGQAERAAPSSEEEKDKMSVRLMVIRSDFLGANRLELLQKLREFFANHKLCTAETPVGFVLTAFDDPGFKIEKYENPILYNIIFMPFDDVILKEHLSFAVAGRVAPSELGLTNQQADAATEILKSVNMEKVSEIGFSSRSNREFAPGLTGKYYGRPFSTDQKGANFVFARLSRCRPHPHAQGQFELEFQFFGSDSSQISAIRKVVRSKDGHSAKERIPLSGSAAGANKLKGHPLFLVIDPRPEEAESLVGMLKRRVAQADVLQFSSLQEIDDDLNLAARVKSNVLTAPITDIQISREQVITAVEPKEVQLWGEPILNQPLVKFISPADAKDLALWLMGAKPFFIVMTQRQGNFGVLKFVRSGKKITVSELPEKERSEYLGTRRRLNKPVTAIIAAGTPLDPKDPSAWQSLNKTLETTYQCTPPIYFIADRKYSDEEKESASTVFEDVFVAPMDRGYFLQKLLFRIAGLRFTEDPVVVLEKKLEDRIKVATKVQVTSISEASMVMKYYRALPLGDFREFILWQPYDLDMPQLLGTVYACEKGEGKGEGFLIHFVLFGMRDQMLKAIRLWIRDNYVHLKEKAG